MSKKHFIAIAAELRRQLEYADDTSSQMAVEDTARGLCSTLAGFNPRFNRSTFLAACGVVDR